MVKKMTRHAREEMYGAFQRENDDKFNAMIKVKSNSEDGNAQSDQNRLEVLATRLEEKVPEGYEGDSSNLAAAKKARALHEDLTKYKKTFDDSFGTNHSVVQNLNSDMDTLQERIAANLELIKGYDESIKGKQEMIDNGAYEFFYVPKGEQRPDPVADLEQFQVSRKETFEATIVLQKQLIDNSAKLDEHYRALDQSIQTFQKYCATANKAHMPTIEKSYTSLDALVDFFKWLASGWGDDAYQSTKTVTQEFKTEYTKVVEPLSADSPDVSSDAGPEKQGGGNQLQ
jgi:hypothetical protein